VDEPLSAAEGASRADIHRAGLDLGWVFIARLRSAVLLHALSTPLVHQPTQTTVNKRGELGRKTYCFAGIFEHRRTTAVASFCIDAEEVSGSNPLSPTYKVLRFEENVEDRRRPQI
jgi:hypothetical protein